jgi:LuxR family transcriptional regulator, quorum-sensing system regulator BjaR1
VSRKSLDHTLDFIRDIDRAVTPTDVCVALLGTVEQYGIQHVIGTTIAAPGSSKSEQESRIILRHWPTDWLDRYMSRNYLAIDPVVKRLKADIAPFAWHELAALCQDSPEAQRLMNERCEFKLKSGFTVPLITLDQEIAGFSLAGEHVHLPNDSRGMFSLVATYALVRTIMLREKLPTTSNVALSERERDALRWAAEGKSEWEIGVILGVSEHTAEKFLRSARVKLGGSNRTHAVAEAIRLGLIT